MIYVTGDMHGEQEKLLAAERDTPLREGDTLIVCGDFGYIFRNDERERAFLDEVENRPYTLCFVDGNHENFPAIYAYPEEIWNGGRVHRIRKNIYHLMRGQVFQLEEKRVFTMGGAYSIDRHFRTEGVSWWPEERPCREEYDEATRNLLACGKKVDYILTHIMPLKTIRQGGWFPDPHDLELTSYLEWILYQVQYQHWYCGHFHADCDLPGKITLMWNALMPME